MKIDSQLRTRVGRRLYSIFLLGVLVPMGFALAASSWEVSREFEEQSKIRLRRAAKQAALAIYDRLELISSEIAVLAGSYRGDPATPPIVTVDSSPFATPRFRSVAVVREDGAAVALLGNLIAPGPLSAQEAEQMEADRPVLRAGFEDGGRILVARAVDPGDLSRGSVWAEIDPAYLWRAEEADVAFASEGELCVFAADTSLHCEFYDDSHLRAGLGRATRVTDAGQFDWEGGSGRHIAAYWTVFLDYSFGAPSWVVVLSESSDAVLAPVAEFQRTFALLVLLSVLVIGFLITREVRRVTGPLVGLTEATRRVARQDFTTPVALGSADEFEEVALSFNRMARDLEKAFIESRELTEDLESAAQLLSEKEVELTRIIESAADGIITCSPEGQIVTFNRTAEEMFGYTRDEVMSVSVTQLIPELSGEGLRVDPGSEARAREYQGRKRDGSAFPLELVVRRGPSRGPNAAMIFAHDLTERRAAEVRRRRLEEQLAQAQKMDTLGSLAGGIAHDFNNLLTPMLVNLELAMMEAQEDSGLRESIEQARAAADQARLLVRQILMYGRAGNAALQPVAVASVVSSTARLLQASLPPDITIREEILTRRHVLADRGKLHQVTMNLCTNACHAMEETGGVLTLRVEEAEVGADALVEGAQLAPGRYVKVSVIDTGKGIGPDVLPHIFERFYTTKGVGKGSGIGLATSRQILRENGGDIAVETAVGRGSTFSFFVRINEDSTPVTSIQAEDGEQLQSSDLSRSGQPQAAR